MFKKDLPNLDYFNVINSETNQKTRSEMYVHGGVLSVTSRILVVDMLNAVIPLVHIHGIIIHNAHHVKEFSSLSFILKIYRTFNKTGFIKALSDDPEAFVDSIGLERRMKNLQVNQVDLVPRFHLSVRRDLDFTRVEVLFNERVQGYLELGDIIAKKTYHTLTYFQNLTYLQKVLEDRISLSKKMKSVQAGLMECLSQMLSELKRMHQFLDIDLMKLENSFSKAFGRMIRNQLDGIW